MRVHYIPAEQLKKITEERGVLAHNTAWVRSRFYHGIGVRRIRKIKSMIDDDDDDNDQIEKYVPRENWYSR